jgi:hypothetical protein
MKRWSMKLSFAGMMLIMGSWLSYGQGDLKEAITGLAGPVAQKYTAPVVSGFGSNLNAGWFHRSPKAKKFGVDIEFGLVFVGTMFQEKDKRFSHTGQFSLTSDMANGIASNYLENANPTWYSLLSTNQKNQAIDSLTRQIVLQSKNSPFNVTIEGATFIGKKKDKLIVTVGSKSFTITDPNNQQQTFTVSNTKDTLGIGGVLESPIVPLSAPQATIGTIMGTQVTIRYLPPVKVYGKVGKLNYFGWGIQHNPAVWLPFSMPMDFAAAFYQQNINQGKLFEAHAIAYGVTVSKQIGFGFLNITPYAGYLRESSKMKFKYTYQLDVDNSIDVKFSEKGINKDRITVGSNFKFLLININADYSFAKKPVYSAGINVSI